MPDYCQTSFLKRLFFTVILPLFVLTNFFIHDLSNVRNILSNRFSAYPTDLDYESDYAIVPKVILLWTSWFSDDLWSEHLQQLYNNSQEITFDGVLYDPLGLNKDGKLKCRFSLDRESYQEASAVVFHGVKLWSRQPPPERLPHQRWVLFQLEAPGGDMNPSEASSFNFNWLMSYRPMADVYFPYGSILPRSGNLPASKQLKLLDFARTFTERPFDAVALVSNCNSRSKREWLFKFLNQSGLVVHVWGSCGQDETFKTPDLLWGSQEKVDTFFRRYRFYLSFENAFCDDYITEKAFAGFYHSMAHGLIPIVLGAGNYSSMFPTGSYIDASKMEPEDLVKKMKKLSATKKWKQIHAFYHWQHRFAINYQLLPDTKYFQRNYALKFGWKRLCEKLWRSSLAGDDEKEASVIHDIDSAIGHCYDPPFLSKIAILDDGHNNFDA